MWLTDTPGCCSAENFLHRQLRHAPGRSAQGQRARDSARPHEQSLRIDDSTSEYIVSQKLSGQALKRQTGVLAGSIRYVPATLEGTSIVGAVEGAGGPAWYGTLYEDVSAGGTGGVSHSWTITATKARALSFLVDGKRLYRRNVTHPALSARPYMTPSLEENADEIETQLRGALDAELNKP